MAILPASVTIDPRISIESRHTALISGTVSDPANTQSVEIVDSVGNDLGPANLRPDGRWTLDAFFDPYVVLQAVSTDKSGAHVSSEQLGIAGDSPRAGQIVSFVFEEGNVAYNVYNGRGRGLYTGTISTGGETTTQDVIGLGGPGIYYKFQSSAFIENFRVAGKHHDTLDLADSSLRTLAQVIQNTTTSAGGATIHLDSQTSVTLVGVTKHELATHKRDFVFGSGDALA